MVGKLPGRMISVPAAAAAAKAVCAVHHGGKIAATTTASRGGCSASTTRHDQLPSSRTIAFRATGQRRRTDLSYLTEFTPDSVLE